MSHIALYLPSLSAGGAERVMVMLANGLAARGHRVDLVLARAEGPYLGEVAPAVRIVDLDRGRVLASLLPLVRWLRRERPDAMLSALNHTNIIAILARKLARIPLRLVVSEHSTPSRALPGGGIRRVMRGLIPRIYPAAEAIVCVSYGVRDDMLQMFALPPDRVHAIYNPVDLDRIHRMMRAPVAHPWLEGTDRPPVILAAGRLTAAKDYPTLLRAMALLRQTLPARLLILGTGEEEAELKRLLSELDLAEHVELAGFQANPYAFMHRCDLYVMSSAWEGLPGALLEALACGCKIVSTDCRSGPAEILEDGKWGRLVPVGDAEALAAAMAAALQDPAPPEHHKRLDAFSLEAALNGYLTLLDPDTGASSHA